MSRVAITDDKIIKFYNENPQLDINTVNAMVIDLIHRIDKPNNNSTSDVTKQYYSEIKDTMNAFQSSIANDTQKLVNESNTTTIKEFMNSFEMKTAMMLQNIQQPIYSFISASEDRINKNISSIRPSGNESSEIYSKLISDVRSIIQPNFDAERSENRHLASTLTKMFNSAEISSKKMGMHNNTIFLKRIGHQAIIVQNYDDECNVSTSDINDCMTLISDENKCGIVLSQNSGISGKDNYQIDMHNNNVVVFVHNVDYSPEKIQVAISIIDNLYNQLRNFAKSNHNTDYTIPKDLLENINNEYQLFISQKSAVVDVFKDSQKRVLAQLDEIRFPYLDKYLSTKYSAPIVKSGLKCELCKSYNANNLKALAAHKRGCIRKQGNLKTNIVPPNQLREQICITPIVFEKKSALSI